MTKIHSSNDQMAKINIEKL